MADPRSGPFSFSPPPRIHRDDTFDERLFDQVAMAPPGGNGHNHDVGPDDPGAEDEEPPPAREGLPAGFRMRADAHYVEHVVNRRLADPIQLIPVAEIDGPHPLAGRTLDALVQSVARFGVLQPLLVRRVGGRYELISGVRRLAAALAAGLTDVPCLVCTADDERALELAEAANLLAQEESEAVRAPELPEGALQELTEQMGAIDACLNLVGDRPRATRERVGLALIRSEVRRAAWLTQALAVISGPSHASTRPVDAAAVLRRTVRGFAADQPLTGIAVEVSGEESATVTGDEQMVALAVAGLIEAAQAAADGTPGAVVVSRLRRERGLVAIEVGLDGRVPEALRAAFADLRAPNRPGGARAGVGVAVARRVADIQGGRLAAAGEAPPRLVLWLPAA